jgi:excisionase family DNA binding protein
MSENAKMLTTAEFSKLTGLTVRTITRMLREGKLRGEKRAGKWAIYEGEHQHALPGKKDASPPPMAPAVGVSATNGKVYDVETFAQMTYLTEKGVRQWLKTGRLSGRIEPDGKATVDAANLDRPDLQHWIRK